MEEATKLYNDAIELLQQADDTPGTEIQAEKLLHNAVERARAVCALQIEFLADSSTPFLC